MDRPWDTNTVQRRMGGYLWGRWLHAELGFEDPVFPFQLSHSARPTNTSCEVPSAEEAGLSPVETLLRVQRRKQLSAAAVQLGADCLGPGHLWYQPPSPWRSQAWFK